MNTDPLVTPESIFEIGLSTTQCTGFKLERSSCLRTFRAMASQLYEAEDALSWAQKSKTESDATKDANLSSAEEQSHNSQIMMLQLGRDISALTMCGSCVNSSRWTARKWDGCCRVSCFRLRDRHSDLWKKKSGRAETSVEVLPPQAPVEDCYAPFKL